MFRTVLLVAGLMGVPAMAKPTPCWFQQTRNAARLPPATCQLYSTGQNTWKLTSNDGLIRTIRLFEDGDATVVLNGGIYRGSWVRDRQGDVRIIFRDSEFIFRL
ncbi:MAG: Uncharacterised protein [Prochlorococcus marinus str. MIT 9215]|nr:MAG: Uncharacterised protein [Prochlorococcus marinus str. MIT 9215]